ncbi:hypothetical protein G6F43_004026 [Rhizopus delemar]|nr:hypothetical protein G6F43_004026 [Rhizopus delemar]
MHILLENSIRESISGQFNYNSTHSFSHQNETSIIGVLEPTRTNAPPPLHSIGILPIDKKTRSSDIHLNIKTSKEQGPTTAIEPLNHRAESSSSSTATFISEPQFHHIYKPHVNRKRRGNLPKEVTEFLKQWLLLHKRHPYPTEREKQQLADETGLMVSQISNWFINARRRILQPLLESENRQQMIQTPRTNLETFGGTQTYYIDTPNGNIESNSSDVLLTKQDQQSVYYTENVHNLNNRFNNNNHYL